MNAAGPSTDAGADAHALLRGARALVAEDDPASRQVLATQLRVAGMQVEICEDGLQALALLQRLGTVAFDVIVTDHHMPGMDGTQLLQRVRAMDGSLAALMLTAADARDVVVGSLRAGVVDFLEKPCKRDLLYAATKRAVTQTRQQRLFRATENEVESLKSLAPMFSHAQAAATAAERWVRHEANLPCRPAGGDFTMHLEIDATRSLIFVGDVSGHDLRAAYIGAYFQGLARGLAEQGIEPGQILRRFNRILLEEFNRGPAPLSLSVAAVSLDWDSGWGEVISAGLPLPVQVTNDGVVRPLGQPTHALGWFEDWEPEPAEFSLAETRWLHIWSDGLEDFAHLKGIDPLAAASRLLATGAPADQLALVADRADDVLVLRLGPAGAAAAWPVLQARYAPADLRQLDRMQAFWERSFAFALPSSREDQRLDWLVAIREATINGLAHGCDGVADGTCTVQALFDPDAGRLRVEIADSGPGYAPGTVVQRDDHESWGLKMIAALADEWKVTRHGATLELHFNLSPALSPARHD